MKTDFEIYNSIKDKIIKNNPEDRFVFIENEGRLTVEQEQIVEEFERLCRKMDQAGITICFPTNLSGTVYAVNTQYLSPILVSSKSTKYIDNPEEYDFQKYAYKIDQAIIPIELYFSNDKIFYNGLRSRLRCVNYEI